ncbi:hypothetical protein GW17_00036622, partial [Ensete ventricosum]
GGCVDTIKGACTLVVDFVDFCFHSYFSYMDDLCEKVTVGETPMDVKYDHPAVAIGCYRGTSRCIPVQLPSRTLWWCGRSSARPRYRKSQVDQEHREQKNEVEQNKTKNGKVLSGLNRTKLASEQSRTMKKAMQQLKPIQVRNSLSSDVFIYGTDHLTDICLNSSADEVEITHFNWPNDKVLDWIFGPLLIMKDQIRRLQLDENEEACLRKLILTSKNEKPEDWDGEGFPSDDNIRKAQLQAIFRRYVHYHPR